MKNSIKKYRKESGFTQCQMAEKLDIAISTYNMIENGQRNVSVYRAKSISEILNVSIDELFFNNNVHNKQTT